MRRYTISRTDHLAHPWLVHELLGDFVVEDVWQFPLRLRPGDTLGDLQREMTAAVRGLSSLSPAALLFRVRFAVGKLLGWDHGEEAGPPRRLYRRFVAAHPDLPAAVVVPSGQSDFSAVYATADEYLGEIENQTVLAALHLGRVPVADGDSVVQLAVYVRPKGRRGRLYMSLIKPFRHLVVYPAIMKATARRWHSYVAAGPQSD